MEPLFQSHRGERLRYYTYKTARFLDLAVVKPQTAHWQADPDPLSEGSSQN
jgi:hypothetical protein